MHMDYRRIAGIVALLPLIGSSCGKEEAAPVDGNPPVEYVTRPQTAIPWPSLASSAWPMARHDAQCTGRSSYQGPTKGKVKYTIPAGTEITDPAFGPDSVFYFASGKILYAATTTGRVLWTFTLDSGTPSENPPLVGADGTIYVGSTAGTYYAVNPDSALKWKTALGGGAIFMKAAGIGQNGTIFVGAGPTLFALSNGGNVLWQKQAPSGTFNFGAESGVVFSPDGNTLYITGATPPVSLYALDVNGNILWADSLGGVGRGCPAVDNDGNVFLFVSGDLVSVTPAGKVRWRIAGAGSNWDVIIDINGNICYLSLGYLVSVDNTGQERWRVRVDNGDYITHLVSDAVGTVYAETSPSSGGGTYNVYAVSISGTVLWKLAVQAYVKVGGPSLSKEGYLLFVQAGSIGGAANQLYIIE